MPKMPAGGGRGVGREKREVYKEAMGHSPESVNSISKVFLSSWGSF